MSSLPHLSLHHAGIWVTDFDRMVEFYRRIFDFHVSDKGRYKDGRRVIFLTLDPNAHHTFVIGDGRPKGSPSTINQISFRTDSLSSVRKYWQTLQRENVERIVPITHGNAWSVYFWDPEDNRIEVFADTPWHTPQPCGEPLDFTQSDEAIIEYTRKLALERTGGSPFVAWRKETAATMGLEDWPLIED